MGGQMKPSDFPRDAKFHDPETRPFWDENGMFHVLSHADVMRVLQNRDSAFSRDQEPYLPDGAAIHMAMVPNIDVDHFKSRVPEQTLGDKGCSTDGTAAPPAVVPGAPFPMRWPNGASTGPKAL